MTPSLEGDRGAQAAPARSASGGGESSSSPTAWAGLLSCDVLVDCMPHGADEWVELDLRALREGAGFSGLRAALVASDGAALERTLGMPLSSVERVAIARYPRGMLAIVRGAFDAPEVVAHVAGRMNTVELTRERPARRIGYLGRRRVDAFALGPRELGLAIEHAAPAERALARAAGAPVDSIHARLAASERAAIAGAALAVHGRRVDFEGADAAPDGVVARVERLTLTLRARPDALAVELLLLGDLPESASEATERWFRGLAGTEFGSLAGISAALPSLTLTAIHDPHPRSGFRLAFALPPDPVCEVLRVWRGRALAELPEAAR